MHFFQGLSPPQSNFLLLRICPGTSVMPLVVSLREVLEAMEMQGDESRAYLDPATGKIVHISDEDCRLVEDDVDPSDLPDWQREELPNIRAALEALESNRLLALPD